MGLKRLVQYRMVQGPGVGFSNSGDTARNIRLMGLKD